MCKAAKQVQGDEADNNDNSGVIDASASSGLHFIEIHLPTIGSGIMVLCLALLIAGLTFVTYKWARRRWKNHAEKTEKARVDREAARQVTEPTAPPVLDSSARHMLHHNMGLRFNPADFIELRDLMTRDNRPRIDTRFRDYTDDTVWTQQAPTTSPPNTTARHQPKSATRPGTRRRSGPQQPPPPQEEEDARGFGDLTPYI